MTIAGRFVPFVRSTKAFKSLSSSVTSRFNSNTGGRNRLFGTVARKSGTSVFHQLVSFSRRALSSSATVIHPLDPLLPDEITRASDAVRKHLGLTPDNAVQNLRFVSISLLEPPKADYIQGVKTPRKAECITLNPQTGIASNFTVTLENNEAKIVESTEYPKGTQPLLTPEDCDLAEAIVQSSPEVARALRDRYGIIDSSRVACDPWSVHLASPADQDLVNWRDDGVPGRLVQTFLYHRQYGDGLEDNHYAHPIDIVPVVDLNARKVVTIHGMERSPAPEIPTSSVQYHRDLVSINSYLESEWRKDKLAPLDVLQPEGPSFTVTGNQVEWSKWKFRVGFNSREGLVLHEVEYDGRPIMHRGSLVEMAVPYADPNEHFARKCAFDVGDYGLGFCANSLSLGCDCLGHIHYFDAILNDSQGNPVELKNAVCMHEEDTGVLWKHVEYRNGHNESRRSRELIISSIATVVNYEYLFYWHLRQDGCIDFKIKLSGELSTNLLSDGESVPSHGVMVAPNVNAQIHQHMFCARLDMSVDSHKNSISEVDMYSEPLSDTNPYGNCFNVKETILEDEESAKRVYDANKARSWKIFNAEGKTNGMTGKPVAYKLLPFSMGPSQPILLTDPSCAVTKKGEFATKHLWVTPHSDKERYPAGECTVLGDGSDGLPDWTKANRNLQGEDLVLWHAFGVAHVPRTEDFPVMPCETTGFTLKPDGFFDGNPGIDLEPTVNKASELAEGCCPNTKADGWPLTKPLQCVSLRVERRGDVLLLIFTYTHGDVGPKSQQKLFALCPIDIVNQSDSDKKKIGHFDEAVVESTRYFVVRVKDEKADREALIGLGFRDREEAGDFRMALAKYESDIKREKAGRR